MFPVRSPFTRLIVTTLSLLILAAPSLAQERHDWADRSEIPSDGPAQQAWASIEAKPCCVPAGNGTSPDAAEAAILKQLAGKAARDGAILRLALDGGRTLRIEDCLDSSICKAPESTYRLEAWWPAQRLYLVHVERSGVVKPTYLVSEKNGRTTMVSTMPVLSPSGRYGIALLSSVTQNVWIDIVDLGADRPQTVSVAPPPCAAFDSMRSLLPPNPVWADDNHVRFEGDMWLPPNGDYRLYAGKALLRIGPGRPQWEC